MFSRPRGGGRYGGYMAAVVGNAHLIPDVLTDGLDIVFCGTAPSVASFKAGAPYAKPGNRFWPTLHAVGLTPRRLAPAEFKTITDFGLGLTDVCKTAFGQDEDLPDEAFEPEALLAKVERYAPRYLAFTSKRSAGEALGRRRVEYGLQDERFGRTRLFVLPSTSGLATRFWDESYWRELAARVR